MDEVLLSTNFFSDVYSSLIVITINGVRVKTRTDSLSPFWSKTRSRHPLNDAGASTATEDERSNNLEDGPDEDAEAVLRSKLQKFVGYVSYLKFLVTFVIRDVSVVLETLDKEDPISAGTFAAAGVLGGITVL